MLGGLDPVIIIHLSKLADTSFGKSLAKIPVISQIPTLLEQPPIPIYLSEQFTGLYIENEDKNVDISTETETLTNGEPPEVNQKGIQSGVTISLLAKKDSTSMILLGAMIDEVFDKVSSKEYAISYLHGATTIFRGLLQSFAISQEPNTDLMSIKIQLSKGSKNPTKKEPDLQIQKQTDVQVLG